MQIPNLVRGRLPAGRTAFRDLGKWGGTLVLMPLILLLDQPIGDNPNWTGQIIGCIVGWIYWFWMYSIVPFRLQRFMVVGLIVALGGELFLAYGVGMYEYRFGNIPFYVPPGHVGAFVVAYLFTREPWVKANTKAIEATLMAASAAYALYWLLRYNDLFGFGLYLCFAVTIAMATSSRLFFLVIFAVTTYMELVGTALGCWHWYGTQFGVASANPPGGISFLYLFFDIGCLGLYLHSREPIRQRYDRWKAFRRKQRKLARSSPPVVAEG